MAWQPPVSNRTSAPAAQTQRESWRKDMFLNFSLPNRNGDPIKLGSIGLKMSIAKERDLIGFLCGTADKPHDEETMKKRCAILVDQLILEIRSAEPDENSGFALPTE